VVLPKRWIVERTIARLNRCRRLAKDWENLNRKALAFLPPRLNPPHAQKTLQSSLKSPDRLYDILRERKPVSPAVAVRLGKLCGDGARRSRKWRATTSKLNTPKPAFLARSGDEPAALVRLVASAPAARVAVRRT
jgi:hypothetical protein